MNELTDPEREAVAVAREKIGTGGYALFNRLYLEFGGYRAEMHFAHGYLVALTQLDALRAELLAANERAKTLRPILRRCADALADEVAVLVCRQVIDSRSPAADALLDYRNDCLSPQVMISPRADRIADLEVDLLAAEEQIAQLRAVLADAQHVFLAISEAGRRAENGRLQKVLDSIAQVYRAHNDFAAKHDVRAILDRGPTGCAK